MKLRLVLLVALPVALVGCQSTGGASRPGVYQESDEFDDFDDFDDFEEEEIEPVFDPLSGYNRVMHTFNDRFFLWAWNPLAKGYAFVIPEPGRVAVDRVFKNLLTPSRFVNSLLQLEFKKSGLELGRLLVNSTLGIGGLFDPASGWFGWDAPSSEDFGQTLGSYGVGEGFPLVLPFFGPTNLRDGFGLIPDSFLNPTIYYTSAAESTGLWAGDKLNRTSLHLGEYEVVKRDALDPYTFFRDAYHQYRVQKIEE